MLVRFARVEDAEEACAVLRASIEVLCLPDHGGDPIVIKEWLANKTPENVRNWITTPGHRIVVAERDNVVIGVGGASSTAEITLNYVSPGARFQGVSKALLSSLERDLSDQGKAQSSLTSTETAHGFYHAAGYEDAGEPQLWGALTGYPMTKALRL